MKSSRRDAVCSRNVLLAVDVHFGKGELARLRVRVGELLEDGRDDLARAAPVGVEVGDDIGIGGEGGSELRG